MQISEHTQADSVARPGSARLPLVAIRDPEAWQDLPAIVGRAREEGPVGVTDEGTVLVLRHDAVESALKDLRLIQNDLSFLGHPPEGFVNQWYGHTLSAIDPPHHTRIRGHVARAFTKRRMEALRPLVADIARKTMVPFLEQGQFSVTGPFAQQLPVRAIMAVLGIPDEDMSLFSQWAYDIGLMFSFTAAKDPAANAIIKQAIEGLDRYVRDLIDRRRCNPGTDLISDLVAGGDPEDRLDEQDLVVLIATFLFAGVETTEAMLPILIALLAQHPDQFQRLKQDHTLLANAVEEGMRLEPNVGVIARVAGEPMELLGVRLEQGQIILASVIAANRDPRRWTQADEYLIDRENTKTIGFGAGIHHCLGAVLAKIELQESLRIFLAVKDMEILNAPRWQPFSNTRQYEELRIGVTM